MSKARVNSRYLNLESHMRHSSLNLELDSSSSFESYNTCDIASVIEIQLKSSHLIPDSNLDISLRASFN